jgi:AcrR family transcriptional regulator
LPSSAPLAPKQPRSRKTLERLVAAGLAILEEEGPSGVTVQVVVARARSSVGSFYARFRSKDELLAYLREHIRESTTAEWSEAVLAKSWSGGALPEVAGEAIDLLLELRARWEARLRAAQGLSAGEADYEAFRRGIVDELAARLLELRSEITHANPEVAVRLGWRAVLGVIEHTPTGHSVGDLTPDALRHECLEFLLRYLVGNSIGGSEQVEFFDVWS